MSSAFASMLSLLVVLALPKAACAQAAGDDAPWDVQAQHGPAHDVVIDTDEGPGCRWTSAPTGRRSSSTCWAISDAADPGRRGGAPPRRGRLRVAAALQPGRGRTRFISDRGGADNVWVCDREGKGAARRHEGGVPPRPRTGVDARRRVARRAQALHPHAVARRRRDLDVPRERRRERRRADREELEHGGRERAGALARRALALLQCGGRLRLQQERLPGHLRGSGASIAPPAGRSR
jgi:hypothetical protein